MNYFRYLSSFLLLVALASMAVLWWQDAGRAFQYDAAHQRAGSLPFIFIGISFITFQLSLERPWHKQVKGLLLGAAFALWGTEQFIQPCRWLTVLDDVVIGIFVVDLGVTICGRFFVKK
jgi:formate-dependent nitrite reductase membrane component NrfD